MHFVAYVIGRKVKIDMSKIIYCPFCGNSDLIKNNKIIMASQNIKICPRCDNKFSVDNWDITEDEQELIDEYNRE